MKFVAVVTLALLSLAAAQRNIVETAKTVPALSTLVTVLSLPAYAPLLSALSGPGNFTVFAPTNTAFTRAALNPGNVGLVTNVLKLHVLAYPVDSLHLHFGMNIATTIMDDPAYANVGGKGQHLVVLKFGRDVSVHTAHITRNETSHVVTADVRCTNGIVHVIDKVLTFPESAVNALPHHGHLNTLLGSVVKAGLAAAVNNTASLTIFAPTDRAFQAVPNFPNLPVADLATILKYHVAPGVHFSSDFFNTTVLPSLLPGKDLHIHHIRGLVEIVDAAGHHLSTVVEPNIPIVNGVIHVINAVLPVPK